LLKSDSLSMHCRYYQEPQRCSKCAYNTCNTCVVWSLLFWS